MYAITHSGAFMSKPVAANGALSNVPGKARKFDGTPEASPGLAAMINRRFRAESH
jgi:hypothetical protein